MGELHPSPTAKTGTIQTNAVTKGLHQDVGAYPASKEVYCKQCGFRCNLARDVRGVDSFVGEAVSKGFSISDHDYDDGHTDDHDYDGSGRTTSTLSEELSNSSLDDWTAGSPDSWTLSGTVTQTTTAGYYDNPTISSASALFTRSGSDISLSQAASTPSDFNAETLTFRVRVKSTTNGVIQLQVSVNSTDYFSSYNVAQQNFQELSVLVKCPTTVSSLTVYILANNANGSAYVDNARLTRYGNPTTASVSSGCPHCGSYDYY